MERCFRYAVNNRFLPLLIPFGFRPSRDGVTVGDEGDLSATFGFVSLRTTADNIAEAHVTTHYRWWTAAGARQSFVDHGLSFGTNADAGVCIHFREPVPSLLRRRGHPALTVTVEDLEGLAETLNR